MDKHVLVVHPDPDMLLSIQDVLEGVAIKDGFRLRVKRAKDLEKAEEWVSSHGGFDLVVTALDIPEAGAAKRAAGEQGVNGLKLVRKIRARNADAPVIIITSHVDDDVHARAQLERALLVGGATDFGKRLGSVVQMELRRGGSDSPQRVDLEIYLSKKNERNCHYQFHPLGQQPCTSQPIDFSSEQWEQWTSDLKAWASVCRPARPNESESTSRECEGYLARLSSKLTQDLLARTPANQHFSSDLARWEGRVGIENIRVRFTLALEDETWPIPVEAFRAFPEEDFWLLKTALYRSLERNLDDGISSLAPLFDRTDGVKTPVNVLIVQAGLSKEYRVQTDDLVIPLDAMPYADVEAKRIESLLLDFSNREDSAVGQVRVIDCKAAKESGLLFKEYLKRVLSQESWHIVHYCGHSCLNREKQKGYLFFPRGDDALEDVPVDCFADWLRNADTRFLFLSSCEGAQDDFVYHVSKAGISGILGFLLDVRDNEAAEFAASFYRNLFERQERSLEYACLDARKEMRLRFPHSPIFASAILVMRSGL